MRIRTLVLLFSALAVAIPVWGFLVEPSLLRNEDYEIAPPDWPPACDGLRIAVLAASGTGPCTPPRSRSVRAVDCERDSAA